MEGNWKDVLSVGISAGTVPDCPSNAENWELSAIETHCLVSTARALR